VKQFLGKYEDTIDTRQRRMFYEISRPEKRPETGMFSLWF